MIKPRIFFAAVVIAALPITLAHAQSGTIGTTHDLWFGGASWNETYWSRPDCDQKLDRARQELDREQRTALYHDPQRMLYEEGGTFISFHIKQVVATSARNSGLQPVFDDAVRYQSVRVSD